MELFNNPWFIGIGGGVFSGLIVALITRAIFSRRENREYAQKVSQANHEVLYAIRPGISEGVIPANDVIRSLIAATARKYSVDIPDMHNLSAVSSELIKGVMDSSFISAQSKQEFCSKLSSIKEERIDTAQPEVEAEYERAIRYRRQMVLMLGIMSGLMTAIAGFAIGFKAEELTETKKLVLLVVPAAVAILASILTVLFKEIQKLKHKRSDINILGSKVELKPEDTRSGNKDV